MSFISILYDESETVSVSTNITNNDMIIMAISII